MVWKFLSKDRSVIFGETDLDKPYIYVYKIDSTAFVETNRISLSLALIISKVTKAVEGIA